MIRHTVAFTLVHPEGSPPEAEFLADGKRTLTAIPEVTDFVVSRQVSPKSTYRYQFAMTFADRAAYERYNAHTDHVDNYEQLRGAEVAEFEELDFEPD